MSAFRAASDDPRVEDLIKKNPKVDGGKVREAQEAIEELRRGGVLGPTYGITSPYERRPLRKPESSAGTAR
jgi:hypothetical protein